MRTLIPRIRVIVSDTALLHSIPPLLLHAGFDHSVSLNPEDALPFVALSHPELVRDGGAGCSPGATMNRTIRKSPDSGNSIAYSC